jgi:hypothetical protein
MNSLFFACTDCKIFVDAGYRWAYWELENAGVVSRGASVNVNAVFAANKYWNPPNDEDTRWLYETVFPSVQEFLSDHKHHRIVFGEEEEFAPIDEPDYLTWMETGARAKTTPRYLAEVLHFKTWNDADAYLQTLDIPPAWWQLTWDGPPSSRDKGRRIFELAVAQTDGS